MAGTPSNSMNLNATIAGIVNWDGSSVMSVTPLTQYSTLAAGSSNTIAQVSPGTAGYVLTSNGASDFPTYQVLPSSGLLVKKGRKTINTKTVTSSVMPVTTVPQNTDGVEITTLAYTPLNAANILEITVWVSGLSTQSVAHSAVLALYQDSTASCLTATCVTGNGGYTTNGVINYYMTAGTTSSTTFKLRFGTNYAPAASGFLDDGAGNLLFSTAGLCTIIISEYTS